MDLQLFIMLIALAAVHDITALKNCPEELGEGVCPDGNTCCWISSGESGCIPGDMGKDNATCCSHRGGCAIGYNCIDSSLQCEASSLITDPLLQSLPQYRLCRLPQEIRMDEFPLAEGNKTSLAYFSSHGDITKLDYTQNSPIQHAVIGVHGSDRNADDYLCSLLAHPTTKNDTLVIAPWFAACSDPGVLETTLCWHDTGGDPNGSWRYGADATVDKFGVAVSSFEAMNHLVSFLLHSVGIQSVTLVGHSSGGQFVQRWSLLSDVWETNRTRAVVANPSSYAYLIPERLYDGVWQIPDTGCATYNTWEWGLEVGESTASTAPYVATILRSVASSELIDRFRERTVIYLVGDRDLCSGHKWCHSHGLETTCQDQLQGYNRFERQFRYLEHLRHLDFRVDNYIIPNVGHDHSLMFNSDQGRMVIFGNDRIHASQTHVQSSK